MTQFLPDNLLQLFAPRPPIPYLPPAEVLLCDKKRAKMQGMAECVGDFEVINSSRIYTKIFFKVPSEKVSSLSVN